MLIALALSHVPELRQTINGVERGIILYLEDELDIVDASGLEGIKF